MSNDNLVRHANYGLQLIDELTGAALVGSSAVSVNPASPPPPPSPIETTTFPVDGSRWVFEDLVGEVLFDVTAEFYLGQTLETGVDIDPVPPDDEPGVLVEVHMLPRTGYPFPPALTRAVGAVRLDATVDPDQPLVPNAAITVTPIHSESPRVEGTPFQTFTADDGQYAVWFLPEPMLEPPSPIAFDVSAMADVVVGGVHKHVEGEIFDQPLVAQSFNGAETILLVETP